MLYSPIGVLKPLYELQTDVGSEAHAERFELTDLRRHLETGGVVGRP